MLMRNVLVALRNAEDLQTVSSYLRETKGIKRLEVAYMRASQESFGKIAVKFDPPRITRSTCKKALKDFDFELIEIDYDGNKLPASAYLDEAVRRHCEAILVVGPKTRPYSFTSLASSLTCESPMPVIVVKA